MRSLASLLLLRRFDDAAKRILASNTILQQTDTALLVQITAHLIRSGNDASAMCTALTDRLHTDPLDTHHILAFINDMYRSS